eukprot:3739399-Pleurochrysis_carterae.AAC.2
MQKRQRPAAQEKRRSRALLARREEPFSSALLTVQTPKLDRFDDLLREDDFGHVCAMECFLRVPSATYPPILEALVCPELGDGPVCARQRVRYARQHTGCAP